MQGSDKTHVEQSLKRAAEPVQKRPLRVNSVYPPGLPLQSTPPTLLLNLPRLPKELDYRVVGHDLVLRDTEANLIIDFLPDAVSMNKIALTGNEMRRAFWRGCSAASRA